MIDNNDPPASIFEKIDAYKNNCKTIFKIRCPYLQQAAIFYAILKGKTEFVKEYFEKYPNEIDNYTQGYDDDTFTPLMFAIKERQFTIATMLIELGANVNLTSICTRQYVSIQYKQKKSVFNLAAQYADKENILLLDKIIEKLEVSEVLSCVILKYAVFDVTKYLLDKALVNIRSDPTQYPDGYDPSHPNFTLMYLLKNKNTSNDNKTDLFKQLISLGAKIPYVLYKDHYMTLISYICEKNNDPPSRVCYNILGIAVQLGNIDIVKIILTDVEQTKTLTDQLKFNRFLPGEKIGDDCTAPIYIALRIQDIRLSINMVGTLMNYGDRFTDLDYKYLSTDSQLNSRARIISELYGQIDGLNRTYMMKKAELYGQIDGLNRTYMMKKADTLSRSREQSIAFAIETAVDNIRNLPPSRNDHSLKLQRMQGIRSGGAKNVNYFNTGDKVVFKKDGKTITRVVFKNKRGTKVVKYKDEWVLFSKLRII